jgi:hypothetical protein
MNKKTIAITIFMLLTGIITLGLSVFGVHFIPNVDSNYVRQSVADRQIEGGGITPGK